MSFGLGTENTAEDIDVLVGATIEKAWLAEWDDGFEQAEAGVVRLRVRYPAGCTVNGKTHGEYEVWVDPEGNGPGFLSFVQEG
jgi:hypothetical protein